MKCTILYKQCCNRSSALIKFSFNNRTCSDCIWCSFQFLDICNCKNCFQKVINTITLFRTCRNKNCISTPFFRHYSKITHFTHDVIRIRIWLIHLVDRNNDRNICCLCMVNCFTCLWHHTIICSNNDNSDICNRCTTCSHRCKCFVTRCIQECNLSIINRYLVGTNCLCNTTSFTSCYLRLTNRIQKCCFTMVNMSHDCNNRWTFFKKIWISNFFHFQCIFFSFFYLCWFNIIRDTYKFNSFIIQWCIDCNCFSFHE